MSKRRINHTGRVRIDAQRVSILVEKSSDDSFDSFDCEINLEDLQLPPHCQVYVEASRINTRQRFEFGTVGSITPPEDRILNRIDRSGAPSFEVKIVDVDDDSLIRGLSPKITIADYDNESLLPLMSTSLPSGTVWQLSNEDEAPVLLVNPDCPGAMEAFRQPLFMSLVLPECFRQVLATIIGDRDYDPDDGDPTNWKHRWVSFGKRLTGVDLPDPDDEDDRQDWANDCLARFSTEHDVVGLFNAGVDVVESNNDDS